MVVIFPNVNLTECCSTEEDIIEFSESCSLALDPTVCTIENTTGSLLETVSEMERPLEIKLTGDIIHLQVYAYFGFPTWESNGVEHDTGLVSLGNN